MRDNIVKVTFDCKKYLNNRVVAVKEAENVSKNIAFNILLNFATNCYNLIKENNLNVEDSEEIFKKGLKCYVNNKG